VRPQCCGQNVVDSSTSKKMSFSERELKKALRVTLMRAALSGLFFTTIATNLTI